MSTAPDAPQRRNRDTAAPLVELPVSTKKKQFGTQLRLDTIKRLDWVKDQGSQITDVVDAAVNDYLDRAGVPRPDKRGKMPHE